MSQRLREGLRENLRQGLREGVGADELDIPGGGGSGPPPTLVSMTISPAAFATVRSLT